VLFVNNQGGDLFKVALLNFLSLSNFFEKSVFLPPQSGEGFSLQNPERETGANPVQYPLL